MSTRSLFDGFDPKTGEVKQQQGQWLQYGLNQNMIIESVVLKEASGKPRVEITYRKNIEVEEGEPPKIKQFLFLSSSKDNLKNLKYKLQLLIHILVNSVSDRIDEVTKEIDKIYAEALEELGTDQPNEEVYLAVIRRVLELMNEAIADGEMKPIDIFLQWQYKIREGQDRKYLEVPQSLFDGPVVSEHIPGNFKEKIVWYKTVNVDGVRKTVECKEGEQGCKKKLVYVDESTGKVHPIYRTEYFLNSENAVFEKLNEPKEEQQNSNVIDEMQQDVEDKDDMPTGFIGEEEDPFNGLNSTTL